MNGSTPTPPPETGALRASRPPFALVVAWVLACGAAACGDVRITVVDVASLELDPREGVVAEGDTIRLRAKLEDADGNTLTGRNVMWRVDAPEIAEVEGNGLVRGLHPGITGIEATVGELTAHAWVTVTRAPITPSGDPCRELEAIVVDLLAIEAANPGSDLADKIEDVRQETESAWHERCAKDPPDRKSAAGDIEGAIDDLEDALDDGLIGTAEGHALAHRLLDASRMMVEEAIAEAEARGGESRRIRQAIERMEEGDALREEGRFKRAASRYESAISRAESA